MSGRLTWDILAEGPPKHFLLIGEIDENSDFESLLKILSGDVILSLKGVARINSTGVREWLQFIRALDAKGTSMVMDECSVAIVNQLNMIAGFAGNAEVRSVHAPYVCPECEAASERVVSLADDPVNKVEELIPCPECGGEMEFDDLPDHYFSFLSGHR